MTERERFWKKVVVRADDECWRWTGASNPGGYGRFRLTSEGNRIVPAHRWAYEQRYGPAPKELHILHRCDNPRCVNPSHLFVGTPQDNVTDKMVKGRSKLNKLTEEQAIYAMARLLVGERATRIARDFGVDRSTISHLWGGSTWKHLFV